MPRTVPIACSLEPAALEDRGAQMAALGQVMVSVQAAAAHARLGFPAEQRDALAEFVAAESSCCPFFTFELTQSGDRIELSVAAPDDAGWAVRGLVAEFAAGWKGLT